MTGRRAVLLAPVGALVAGCGFHPLYAPAGSGGHPVMADLASIYVAVMPERPGQLLRQGLQRRFDGAGDSGVAKQYELTGSLDVSSEQLGIQRDTSATYVRVAAVGRWFLRKLDVAHTPVTAGSARATEGYDIYNQQVFAQDLEGSVVQRRLAEAVADQITLQLATYFKQRTVQG